MTQTEHKKYIVIGQNYVESQQYDSLQDAEDKATLLIGQHPNLKVAVYMLHMVGEAANPPIRWNYK
jgi:hypothetical protein